MYTEGLSKTAGKNARACGVMMTQNQGHGLTPTVSTIVIERVLGYRVKRHVVQGRRSIAEEHPYLDHYYRPTPDDEHDFMSKHAEVFYLGDPKKPAPSDVGKAALELFKGWRALNTYGLHG